VTCTTGGQVTCTTGGQVTCTTGGQVPVPPADTRPTLMTLYLTLYWLLGNGIALPPPAAAP
jgi:hypothetical protein